MEEWSINMAKMFKERENKAPLEPTTGKVIGLLPNLRLSLGDEIILDDEDIIVSNRIYSLNLVVGDELILFPSANGQAYYVMDKVGG
ncbi:hypothetical protein SAMN05444162_3460 [Paenibacillaceae bacterium GAS479]|nr:hypothetical protein SAMN05444162_3460 [Paenibacillaceae bacterium GAS479]